MKTNVPQLADKLKALREARGLSQQDLAVSAGLSVSLVSQIEQGKKYDLRISTLKALAKALMVRWVDLAGEEDDPAPSASRGRAVKKK